MKKNSLTPNKGLSLSQASSISNLCNQKADEIEVMLESTNVCEKKLLIDGVSYTTVKGRKLPDNVLELLEEKARLHACQAFLMENIKAKEDLIEAIKRSQADVSSVIYPEKIKYIDPVRINDVKDSYGEEQFSVSEINEFLEVEAYASTLGKFFHKDGKLDRLRKETSKVSDIEWKEIKEGIQTPVTVTANHTSEDLMKLHEKLAVAHRTYESRVNYFKAKAKNIVTEKNAEIAKLNADAANAADKINNDLRTSYELAMKKANEEVQKIRNQFEQDRQAKIKEAASTRINVDLRFKPIIDDFLAKISKSDNE